MVDFLGINHIVAKQITIKNGNRFKVYYPKFLLLFLSSNLSFGDKLFEERNKYI